MASKDVAKRKRVVIHEDDVGMTHGANAAFVELTQARHLQLRIGDGPLPLVSRGRRDRRRRPLARPRHPRDADQRAEALSLASRDDAAAVGRAHRQVRLFLARRAAARAAPPPRRSRRSSAPRSTMRSPPVSTRPISTPIWAPRRCRSSLKIFAALGRDYRLPVLLVKDLSGYNPASYAGPLDPAGYDAEVAKAQGRGRADLRGRLRDAVGAHDQRGDRLSQDLRRDSPKA